MSSCVYMRRLPARRDAPAVAAPLHAPQRIGRHAQHVGGLRHRKIFYRTA